jgi:predicted nucleic acid-binding protein
LQGVSTQREFESLVEYLGSLRFYNPEHPLRSYEEAARLYFDCRLAGVTIRSATDCLIARLAVENDLLLLRDDREFERVSDVA